MASRDSRAVHARRPHRVHIARGAGRIGEILLSDQNERPLRHPAAVHVAFGGRDLLEGAAHMHGAGPAARRIAPRDATLHREIELERRRAVPEAAVRPRDPAGQEVACQVRDTGGGQVEQRDVGAGQLAQRADASARLDTAAVCPQQRRQRVGDGAGTRPWRRATRSGARHRASAAPRPPSWDG